MPRRRRSQRNPSEGGGGYQPPLLLKVPTTSDLQEGLPPPPRKRARGEPTEQQRELAAVLRKCGVRVWRIAYTIPVNALQDLLEEWIAEKQAGADVGPGLLYHRIEQARDEEELPDIEAPDLRSDNERQNEWLERRYNETRRRRESEAS